MGAVLKIFAYLGSAIGAVVWLGGTALVAFALTSAMSASPDSATALAKLIVVIAGVVVALVASVVLLRVTRNLIWFFVCFACGAFAALAGAGFSPASLSGESSVFAIGALASLAVSVIILAITKRMVPFLVCLGLLGLAGAGAVMLLGVGAGSTMSTQVAPSPEGSSEGATSAPAEAPMPLPPPAGAGQGAPPPEAADILPGAGAPATESASGGGGSADEERAARAEAETGLAAKPRVASRSLRPPSGLETAAPAPPPPAAAADPLDQPSGGGLGTYSIPTPPPAVAHELLPTVADAKPSDFQTAELKFNKPEKMEIDVAYTVSATIAGALAETQATLGNVGPTVTRDVKITRKVRVELVASDFDIKKLHAIDTVLITPETSGQWSWQVTPRRLGGERKMLLQVYGVIERDGIPQGETLIKTYEETIPVQVTPMARVRLISQGIVERWQPIAGALGVIGGIWVFLQKLLGALTRRRKIEVAN